MAGPLRDPGRQRDLEILYWIELKCAGRSWREVGEMFGKSPQNVAATAISVRNADVQECEYFGDDPAEARRAYW